MGLSRGWPEVIPYVRVPQLVSEFLSEGIAPYVAVHLECTWEGGKSESSYVAILVQSPIHVCLSKL